MTASPLRITVPLSLPGPGLSICPGKIDPWANSGPCSRDLAADIKAIKDWGASLVITLLEPFEFQLLHGEQLGDFVLQANTEWWHWPVIDGSPLIPAGFPRIGPIERPVH